MRKGVILSLTFAIIVTIFALQNAASVSISFLTFHVNMSEALVILISAICGAIVIAITSFFREYGLKKKIKSLNKNIEELKKEVSSLKIPDSVIDETAKTSL